MRCYCPSCASSAVLALLLLLYHRNEWNIRNNITIWCGLLGFPAGFPFPQFITAASLCKWCLAVFLHHWFPLLCKLVAVFLDPPPGLLQPHQSTWALHFSCYSWHHCTVVSQHFGSRVHFIKIISCALGLSSSVFSSWDHPATFCLWVVFFGLLTSNVLLSPLTSKSYSVVPCHMSKYHPFCDVSVIPEISSACSLNPQQFSDSWNYTGARSAVDFKDIFYFFKDLSL